MTSGESTLDAARRALYAGPRATFVERRQELATASRKSGDRDEAKLIAQMRKPTAAAHLVNQLAQAGDVSLRELIELGADIRRAMAAGRDAEMRSLLRGRAPALAKTMTQVKEIARASGESVTAAVGEQVVQTLRAAMASDDAADAVRGGALSDALDEPGFEGFTIESATRAPLPTSAGRKKARPKPGVAVARAEEAAAHAAAQTMIKSATADVKRAEKALAATTERREGLERDRERLAAQLAEIDEELAAAQAELDGATARLSEAVERAPQAPR